MINALNEMKIRKSSNSEMVASDIMKYMENVDQKQLVKEINEPKKNPGNVKVVKKLGMLRRSVKTETTINAVQNMKNLQKLLRDYERINAAQDHF